MDRLSLNLIASHFKLTYPTLEIVGIEIAAMLNYEFKWEFKRAA